jgi:drug/metabolite transporter (DMT)-like permease
MLSTSEALSLLLVGAFWGCTNPLMRKGYIDTKSPKKSATQTTADDGDDTNSPPPVRWKSYILTKLVILANYKVWLPYLINQLGSILYYKTLASSNLTLSVPICNATAMVFSSITSAILGERVNQPIRAAVGVVLVLSGVAVCMMFSNENEQMLMMMGNEIDHEKQTQNGEL